MIYHGDAPTLLGSIETSVDAVLTDPPYASGSRTEASRVASGAMLRDNTDRAERTRFADRPIDLDQMTTTGFVWLLRSVALACYDLLPPGGSFLSFIDWRQWSNLAGAIETCNYRVQGMVVWDKGSMGLGNGFRAQHELICHASKGVPTVYDRSSGNVLDVIPDESDRRFCEAVDRYFSGVEHAPRVPPLDHPSPKPVGLMRRLMEVVSPPGGVILDPFMGSGSTLRAAMESGRQAIGIERDERYCEVAARRLDQGVLDFGGVA